MAEVRSLATERGGDRLWIERVELQTRPPRAVTMPDGPIEELLEVLEQLRADPASMNTVVDELAELKRKLPAELIHDPDSPRLDDARMVANAAGTGPAAAPGLVAEIRKRRHEEPSMRNDFDII